MGTDAQIVRPYKGLLVSLYYNRLHVRVIIRIILRSD